MDVFEFFTMLAEHKIFVLMYTKDRISLYTEQVSSDAIRRLSSDSGFLIDGIGTCRPPNSPEGKWFIMIDIVPV
jgi:hypothetical protein